MRMGTPILFQNLGFYYMNNQSAMLDKNLTAGSILEEWPLGKSVPLTPQWPHKTQLSLNRLSSLKVCFVQVLCSCLSGNLH